MLVLLDAAEAVAVAKIKMTFFRQVSNLESSRTQPSAAGEVGRGWSTEKRGLTLSSALWLSFATSWARTMYGVVSTILVLTDLITYEAATIIAIFI